MTTHSTDYTHGDMPIQSQKKTYSGFLVGTIWGGGALIVMCLLAILVFAANVPAVTALGVTLVVGVLYGLLLKLGTGWYALVIAILGIAAFAGLISLIL